MSLDSLVRISSEITEYEKACNMRLNPAFRLCLFMRGSILRNSKNVFFIIVLGLIIIWMGYILIYGKGGVLKRNPLEQKIIILESEIKELELENNLLDIKIENLKNNKKFIQGYARELGYKKEGDVIYKFINKDKPE